MFSVIIIIKMKFKLLGICRAHLLAPWFFDKVAGVLTAGSTVTASSIYSSRGEHHVSDCLQGLVDGYFDTGGVDVNPTPKCCATTQYDSPAWLNIDLGTNRIIQSVVIANRDGLTGSCLVDCPLRIIGSDLYVGNDPLPINNVACLASPQDSGLFSCGGKQGRYIGLYK